ncbi:MAG: sulfite exporter TauE/SafE family protein [Methanomassiliicoccales archaeon]|nr:MAG: sulfite exporter TauE/SafE family protein [Methanomassiliicoccales archaeon]
MVTSRHFDSKVIMMSEFIGALISLIAIAFILGLIRGTAVCTLLCGPSLLSYTLSEGRNWRSGAVFALKFNIGRIALITAVGAVIGYFAGVLISGGFDMPLTTMYFLGYFLVGLYSIVLGAMLYRRARKRALDPECDCQSHFKTLEKFRKKYPKLFANETMALIILGLFMGIACLLEITLLDAVILGSASALFSVSYGLATALTGALTMFIFGVGSAIPVIAFNASAGYASSKFTPQKINSFTGIMAIALITMGIIVVLRQGLLLSVMVGAT